MKLHCLGSGSSGNCYIFTSNSGERLILECGVHYQDIQKAIDWHPASVVGCIVSHEHRDHCSSLVKVATAGIKVFALADVFDSFPTLKRAFRNIIRPNERFRAGNFTILPLSVMHDVPCLGFVIHHREMGNLLFLTDTMYTEYRVKGLNNILIEANYDDEILSRNIAEGREPASMRSRLLGSHMEIKSTIKILNETDLTNVRNIMLIHISSRNGDFNAFRERISKLFNPRVVVARTAVNINLDNEPY